MNVHECVIFQYPTPTPWLVRIIPQKTVRYKISPHLSLILLFLLLLPLLLLLLLLLLLFRLAWFPFTSVDGQRFSSLFYRPTTFPFRFTESFSLPSCFTLSAGIAQSV